MADTRYKDREWVLRTDAVGRLESWEQVQAALLMDLRDELKKLNALLTCPNFTAVPGYLRETAINTRKKKRPLKAVRRSA